MKNLFLDIGSHFGQAFGHFCKEMYPLNEFDYILFEPNPNSYNFLLNNIKNIVPDDEKRCNSIKVINSAVYIENTTKKFLFDGKTCQSGTIIKDHFSRNRNEIGNNYIDVNCIDINNIVEENSLLYKDIIIKLDCECSEYDILESLIKTKNIHKIKKIYCEFHTRFMNSEDKSLYLKREHNIVVFLKENNIDLINWK